MKPAPSSSWAASPIPANLQCGNSSPQRAAGFIPAVTSRPHSKVIPNFLICFCFCHPKPESLALSSTGGPLMSKIPPLLAVGALIAIGCATAAPGQSPLTAEKQKTLAPDVQKIVAGNTQFALDLYQQLRE